MSQSQPPTREVARRVFASEFNDATFTFKESEDERAPLYALLPTGEQANRVFIVGTLTETEDIGDESEYWRGRVVDPTGTFFVYAGQYQPDAAGTLRELETPSYVAVVGKPRTFETDDGSVNVSVRPESITEVDERTRDRWVVETAELTLERLAVFDEEANEYGKRAQAEYDQGTDPYREAVLEALESLDESGEAEGAEKTGDAQTPGEADGEDVASPSAE